MNPQDLLFFNKEGHPMNVSYDTSLDMYQGNIFFDKNSTDTFKTQGIYVFEKVPGSNHTFQAELNKFQLFNTNGFITYPQYEAPSLLISNIENTNISSNYYTKWIYATDIEKYYYTGMWIYFQGLNTYHTTDFDTLIGNEYQVRKVIAVEVGRILVYTETNNSIPVPTFTPNIAIKIIPINVIEIQQSYSTGGIITSLPVNNLSINQVTIAGSSEPIWTENNINNLLYSGKKISLVDTSDNTGVYTVKNLCVPRFRHFTKLSPTLFNPIAGDQLILEFEFRTSKIILHNGLTIFTQNGSNNDSITLTYVPKFLKIGDTIIAQTKNAVVNSLNQATLTITDINYTTNVITVNSTSLLNQTVDCYLFLASNTFKITQDLILDNNNLYSLPVTYWSIMNQYSEILQKLPGGARLEYLTDTDELLITSDYTDNFINLKIQKKNSSNIITQYTVNGSVYQITPIYIEEQLKSEFHEVGNSTIFNRTIVFNSIDSFGLNMIINGVRYGVDYDLTISNTTTDFISQFQTDLALLGIIISAITTNTSNDTLIIQSEYPNIPIVLQMDMGDSSDFYIKYKNVEFNNIKSQLLITINNQNYIVPFTTSDLQTVINWVAVHKNILLTYGIIIKNDGINPIIQFNIKDPLMVFNITYNIGYLPKSGDLSIYETQFATNSTGSLLAGNEITIPSGSINFLNYYSTGQKISIQGASKLLQNKSYNILALTSNTLSISYQGPYWNDPTISGYKNIQIVSDYFIRFPKAGFINQDQPTQLIWSWKDTQIDDFFLYDFTGNQLTPWTDGFPNYNGPKPLCGEQGEIELKLITQPNQELKYIQEPTKQQTIFDVINYTLPYINQAEDITVEPIPLQVFMGYRANYESWSKVRLYLSIIENIFYELTTSNVISTNSVPPAYDTDTVISADDLWVFKDNYVEIQNTLNLNFLQLGFKVNQYVQFNFEDINTDQKKIAVLENAGPKYKIASVTMTRITFTNSVIPEISVKKVSKTTLPMYDQDNNPLYEFRTLKVSITVIPKVIAYFDVYGESEQEDERYKIAINNKNLNLLKLQDFFIFKEVDINEQGIDWIFLNRKRKELLEIYPQIFNHLSSYKSVIQAINFFGYNDLTFTEYFQNINPESKKFGQIFNMELLQLFDKSVPGFTYSNLAFENLRNEGFRKTNLFSLNYRITDTNGNFISAYSMDEVRIKLLGLKKWLTENIIPIGTKILDINGKYQMPQNIVMKYETYASMNYRIEEYASPVDFKCTGYLQPINLGSNTYDISVNFFSASDIDWFEYNIRTFYLEEWSSVLTYVANSYVYYAGKAYQSITNIAVNEQPGISSNWVSINLESLPNVQILKDYQYDVNLGTSFTVNKLTDPHFIVEVMWHSGYGIAHTQQKTFSVIPGFFNGI